eukprot:Skav235024  [mRNA]  locus=scaffold276:477118:481634:- [translate_table: standard]
MWATWAASAGARYCGWWRTHPDARNPGWSSWEGSSSALLVSPLASPGLSHWKWLRWEVTRGSRTDPGEASTVDVAPCEPVAEQPPARSGQRPPGPCAFEAN